MVRCATYAMVLLAPFASTAPVLNMQKKLDHLPDFSAFDRGIRNSGYWRWRSWLWVIQSSWYSTF